MSLIVASTLGTAFAAKTAITTIPIVFFAAGDTVVTGLVASLNRPGGNLIGVSTLGGELGARRLGLLHTLVSTLQKLVLFAWVSPASGELRDEWKSGPAIGQR